MNIEEELKVFVSWTKLKFRLHISPRRAYAKERQIWWVSLGQNIGAEINGKNEKFERPVLIIKKFNVDTFLVAPLSTRIKTGNYYFYFKGSSNQPNIINLAQLRTIDGRRFIRKIGRLDAEIFEYLVKKLKNLL